MIDGDCIMIGFVRGRLCDVNADGVLLDTNGIGYNIMISNRDSEKLPAVGEEVRLFTYMSVREDAIKLYGFLTKDDLEFFKLLIMVNGIGPKGAQGILSFMDVNSLRMAILAGDTKTIAKCPGVGTKTAQRIILDLKDKAEIDKALDYALNESTLQGESVSDNAAIKEAADALSALGFSPAESLAAVRKVENAAAMDIEDIIKAALKFISIY